MSTITSLQTTDTGAASRGIINTNFTNLNTDKLEKSGGTLTGEINFSGTTHAGVKLNSLTTTQRDALTPANGMIIYNSTTGQVEKYESGSWVGATGIANASNAVEGIVELATQAEIDSDTATGGTGAALAVTPDQLVLSKYGTGIPSSDQKAALAGTSGTPSSTNKYVTNDDTATAATANKVARRLAGGNITVVTESQANNSTNAASTAYVDTGLAANATSKRIYTDTTTHTFTNSGAANTLLTTTITGGSLSTANILRFRVYYNILDGDNNTWAFKLTYGATDVVTLSISDALPNTSFTGYIEGELLASGATNTQIGMIRIFGMANDFSLNGSSSHLYWTATGTAAEDSTANKTFTITSDATSTNADFQTVYGYIELIK